MDQETREFIAEQFRLFKTERGGLAQSPPDFTELKTSVDALLQMLTEEASQEQQPASGDPDSESEHPHSLCQSTDCKTCVEQAAQLIDLGRSTLSATIDEALILAGGLPMKERVSQLIEHGKAISRYRNQVVEIGAE